MSQTLLSFGSQGSSVSALQTSLNAAGYNLPVTGYFGNQTQAAVRDYQSKNGLSPDGIAGPLTMGKLSGTSTSSKERVIGGLSDETAAGLKTTYTPSAAVTQAQKDYEAALSSPSAEAPSDAEMQKIYDSLQNRSEFSYVLEDDPIYQQYKTQYERLGRSAMEDTMGQAAGLTGGYGSTYAETAGQQQYHAYLQQLGDQVPGLYQAAQDSYDREGDRLTGLYDMAKSQYNTANDQYLSTQKERETAIESARKRLESAESFSYQEYQDMLNYYLQLAKLENSDYQKQQDRLWG